MIMQDITMKFQAECNQGHAQYDIEVLDKNKNIVFIPDDIIFVKDHDRNVVQIIVHPKKDSKD